MIIAISALPPVLLLAAACGDLVWPQIAVPSWMPLGSKGGKSSRKGIIRPDSKPSTEWTTCLTGRSVRNRCLPFVFSVPRATPPERFRARSRGYLLRRNLAILGVVPFCGNFRKSSRQRVGRRDTLSSTIGATSASTCSTAYRCLPLMSRILRTTPPEHLVSSTEYPVGLEAPVLRWMPFGSDVGKACGQRVGYRKLPPRTKRASTLQSRSVVRDCLPLVVGPLRALPPVLLVASGSDLSGGQASVLLRVPLGCDLREVGNGQALLSGLARWSDPPRSCLWHSALFCDGATKIKQMPEPHATSLAGSLQFGQERADECIVHARRYDQRYDTPSVGTHVRHCSVISSIRARDSIRIWPGR